MEQSDVISNPLAPNWPVYAPEEAYNRQPLSNSDFRKLLMTPRAPLPPGQPPKDSGVRKDPESLRSFSTRGDSRSRPIDPDSQPQRSKNKVPNKRQHTTKHRRPPITTDANKETSAQYRDRAKERREGKLVSHVEGVEDTAVDEADVEQDADMLTRTADYRAVAPSSAAGATHAERRREIIDESKYLGGDMEHTHLVKGLDYVLLQKVRMEIEHKEQEVEELLDAELQKPLDKKEEGPQFKTRIAANIYDILFKTCQLERNEYFQPGRMAYRVDLEDELAEFDVPATVIRSKADCQYMELQDSCAWNTNDIVINKLTQIFSYLRAGRRQAKKAKAKQRTTNDYEPDYADQISDGRKKKPISIPIYEDINADYNPRSTNAVQRTVAGPERSSGDLDRNQNRLPRPTDDRVDAPKSKYFERPEAESDLQDSSSSLLATKEFIRDLASKNLANMDDEQIKEKASLERLLKKSEISGYDECYPGFAESYDAMGDSDDDTDFSKMDVGSKKGPIGRWDFETQEEYGEYMSNKEAMPRAAFQYGVKKPEGRRTRRIGGGQKNEKNETDREWQQIQAIISKRKGKADDEPTSKKLKS